MSKIRVNKVELKNFFSYGNSWHVVDLHEGLNVVLGYDNDKDRSNGSGKTSFLEAVPFALFGSTMKGSTLNKIVNWGNGKHCEVRLHFEKNGIQYEIQRGIKPGIIELIKDGVKVPKLSDKRMFQQELELDLIGMDFRAAQAIHFQNANNMISMFNTPKAEKRKFIEKFFNLEIYSAMNEHVNGKLRNLEAKRSELDSERTFKERRMTELEMEINGCIAPNIAAYEQSVVDAERVLQEYTEANSAYFGTVSDDIESNIESGNKNISELEAEMIELNKELKEVELTRASTSQRINSMSERLSEIGDLSTQREKLDKLKAGLEQIGNIEEQVKESKNRVAEIQGRLLDVLPNNRTLKDKLVKANADLKEWQEKGVLDTAECPTCFQQADAEHIKSHIEEQVKICLKEIDKIEASMADGTETANKIQAELDAEKEVLAKAEERNETRRVVEKKIAELSDIDAKEAEVEKIRSDLKTCEELMEKYAEYINNYLKDIGGKDTKLKELKASMEKSKESLYAKNKVTSEVALLTEKVESQKKVLESQREISERVMAEQAARIASRDQMQSELSDWSKKYEKLDTMKDYLAYIKETLKDENVKQYAISNIVPYVQQRTNHYLSETGHNYYIELDNWLDGEIKGFGVGENDFSNMSGGEGKSIDLALKFAMMDVARRQAGSYLDILVLDELLDSSIDSFGLEKTVDIVKVKQREDELKVFVVSHREEIAMFEFDRTYNVVKENGFSTITVS